MKSVAILKSNVAKFAFSVMMMFFSVVAFAQENTPTVDVNTTKTTTTTTEEWYTNPLYWIIGAILLIILVAVVARGNGNKN